ncbi:hypothetical protein LTSEWAN_5435 [Salmonella enterica subsp. enterica serovar Wandsworth str. A4-580]|uniref:Uncharacterized protein n=1 Tax=Salmonella enterica subsp. enterica serovar Wandsworth str. A4-580 TaxID=913086 RepID=G5SIC7_SALET|nr:hypothetical protein LTSEWAN_5435 [Salmonella enterica subsp. enterica serovar Wandsworth str. A4-580]
MSESPHKREHAIGIGQAGSGVSRHPALNILRPQYRAGIS